MSEFYGDIDKYAARQTLAAAVSVGVTPLDIDDMYGQGNNERLPRTFVRAHSDEVVIASKFRNVRADDDSMSISNVRRREA